MNGYLPGGSNRLTESVKTMNLRPLNLLLTGTLLFLVGCIQTDTAVVRSDRPSMATYGRTTAPQESE